MNITWGLIAGGVSIMAVYRKEEGCCAVTDSGHVRVHLDAQTALLYRYQSPVNHAGFFTHSSVFPGQAHPCISFRTWSLAYAMMESRTSTKAKHLAGGDGVDFVAVVDQVIALLRQRGRVTYRTLQRQFQLDAEALTDLLAELRYAHPDALRED